MHISNRDINPSCVGAVNCCKALSCSFFLFHPASVWARPWAVSTGQISTESSALFHLKQARQGRRLSSRGQLEELGRRGKRAKGQKLSHITTEEREQGKCAANYSSDEGPGPGY